MLVLPLRNSNKLPLHFKNANYYTGNNNKKRISEIELEISNLSSLLKYKFRLGINFSPIKLLYISNIKKQFFNFK